MPGRMFHPYYGGYDQIFLLPPSLREWLPADLDLTTYSDVTRGAVSSDSRCELPSYFSCNHGSTAAMSLRRWSFVRREAQGE